METRNKYLHNHHPFQVMHEHKGESLETLRERFNEKSSNIPCLMDHNWLISHSATLLDDMKPEDTISNKIIGDAIRTLTRVMRDIENNFKEFKRVLEESMETSWRWQEFKKELEQLKIVSEDIRDRLGDLVDTESELFNDLYTILQSAKTTLHELTKQRDNVPIIKQGKADKTLRHIEEIMKLNFHDIGTKNERLINTEFVLNIQYDILSWIKEFEDLLFITPDSKDDVLRAMIEKDGKIKKKLKYCPVEVIEEYFETCQKIGTDFLLGSVRGVETCITRLIGKIVETSQQITSTIHYKASLVNRRMAGMLERVIALDEKNVLLVECITSFEKVISLIGSISSPQAIEYPDIADFAFLQEQQSASHISYVEVLDEITQTIDKCVEIEYNELMETKFHGRRTSSTLGKRLFSSSRSRKGSLRKMVVIPKCTDEYINDIEELVRSLEQKYSNELIDGITSKQSKHLDQSSDKLYHVLKEFKDTEKSYIKCLEYLAEELIQKAVLDEDLVLEQEEYECLRTSLDLLQRILKVNKSLDSQVRNSNGGALKFARVFTSLINDMSVYTDFIKHQPQLERILTKEYFKEIQTISSESMPAESFVNKPMQRITKYRLLFEETLANTKNVFEVPSINQAVLHSHKLLKTINGILHLQEEAFFHIEESEFYLYAQILLTDSTQRKAYLFRNNLYLSKNPTDYVSYQLASVRPLEVDESKLEMTLEISMKCPASVSNSLMRKSTLKKNKGPTQLTIVFSEYNELIEWQYKIKYVLGKYY